MATSNAAIPLSGVRFDKYSALRVRSFFYECTKQYCCIFTFSLSIRFLLQLMICYGIRSLSRT